LRRAGSSRDLVERGRAGDREALEELFKRYEKGLYGFVRRFVQGAAEPMDVYQEVLLRAIENLHRYNVELSFRTWLFTLAANYCKNILRTRRQRGKFRGSSVRRLKDDVFVNVLERTADGAPEPDRAVEGAEFMEALEKELMNLPAEQREVFILREFNGIPFKEISTILNIPAATARSRMFLAIEHLRARLKQFSTGGTTGARARRH
jgi:RNA polymerase sigma-70 factor (ECF subfamily)